MISRNLEADVLECLKNFPVCGILGSRQVGKTTLARKIAETLAPDRHILLDLESQRDLNRLSSPQIFLEKQKDKLVILDEIQRKPELFPLLRYLVDQGGYRFLVLGSSSPQLLRQSSESLAGRIRYLESPPFSLGEVNQESNTLERLWLRGGYPQSFLARDENSSFEWRTAFIQSLLERDLPQLGFRIPVPTLRRFWEMVGQYNARTWNASEIAKSMDMTPQSMNRYLDILAHTFLIRILPPYLPNVKKRLIKSPKVHFRDSGLLHHMWDVLSYEDLLSHRLMGFSWESFAVEQIISSALPFSRFYFYRTAGGAEVDLVAVRPDHRPVLYEMKYSSEPKPRRGLHSAIEDLNPEAVYVVYPGPDSYPLDKHIEIKSLHELVKEPG